MKTGILIGHLNNKRNESALIRSAEVFGVNQIHVVNGAASRISSTVACGADRHVFVHHHDTLQQFVCRARDTNHNIVAVENAPGATPLESEPDYPVNPIFVVGNEGRGVPEQVMDAADMVVTITQSPNSYVRCLNTTVAGSVVMHDWFASRLSRDKRQHDFVSIEA